MVETRQAERMSKTEEAGPLGAPFRTRAARTGRRRRAVGPAKYGVIWRRSMNGLPANWLVTVTARFKRAVRAEEPDESGEGVSAPSCTLLRRLRRVLHRQPILIGAGNIITLAFAPLGRPVLGMIDV